MFFSPYAGIFFSQTHEVDGLAHVSQEQFRFFDRQWCGINAGSNAMEQWPHLMSFAVPQRFKANRLKPVNGGFFQPLARYKFHQQAISCKRLGVEPYAYLHDILRRLPSHPNKDIRSEG